jgi:protein gp37
MSTQSNISWTEPTWNPVTGCDPISPGCTHCYAATMSHRLEAMGQERYAGLTVLGNQGKRFNGMVRLHDDKITEPLEWRKPKRVFVCSMSDLFHEAVPFEFVNKVWSVMLAAMRHTFQVLTKRPERMAEFFATLKHPWHAMDGPDKGADNIWLGTSAEDNDRLCDRQPYLRACPAAVRFLSLEPLLGDMPSLRYMLAAGGIDWVIVGGESGFGFRKMNHAWLKRIVDDCQAQGIPVFVKQDSGPRSGMTDTIPGGYLVQEYPQCRKVT